jgi:hypothetical protein
MCFNYGEYSCRGPVFYEITFSGNILTMETRRSSETSVHAVITQYESQMRGCRFFRSCILFLLL